MNCIECNRVLPEMLEGQLNAELEAHLTSCVTCSALVADLNAIVQEAASLKESEEPSDPPSATAPHVATVVLAELAPRGVAGSGGRGPDCRRCISDESTVDFEFRSGHASLTTAGRRRKNCEADGRSNTARGRRPANSRRGCLAGAYDEGVLRRQPAQRECLYPGCRDVQQDPYDQEARQYLMEAYEQKAMLYDMALNRSLR